MKKLITITFLFFTVLAFAQSKKIDTYYILFDHYKDKHHEKANFPTSDICVDEKYIHFGNGTSVKVKKFKELKYPITNRKKLSTVIANDSFENKNIAFYIIEKVGDYYYMRNVDYRFRIEDQDERYWLQKVY